ncbi:MAG TPA: hypothetical protein VNZ59_17275, partial [Burkholderiales bacterium]|nr:hypothetical protein [Burkholderiales bacterium]
MKNARARRGEGAQPDLGSDDEAEHHEGEQAGANRDRGDVGLGLACLRHRDGHQQRGQHGEQRLHHRVAQVAGPRGVIHHHGLEEARVHVIDVPGADQAGEHDGHHVQPEQRLRHQRPRVLEAPAQQVGAERSGEQQVDRVEAGDSQHGTREQRGRRHRQQHDQQHRADA